MDNSKYQNFQNEISEFIRNTFGTTLGISLGLVLLKLIGVISWSWVWVFCPVWIILGFLTIIALFVFSIIAVWLIGIFIVSIIEKIN